MASRLTSAPLSKVFSITIALVMQVLVPTRYASAQTYNFEVLHTFTGGDSAYAASMVQATDGNFYGVRRSSGSNWSGRSSG